MRRPGKTSVPPPGSSTGSGVDDGLELSVDSEPPWASSSWEPQAARPSVAAAAPVRKRFASGVEPSAWPRSGRKRKCCERWWLPVTCAYRLRAEGKPLYAWHHLISGDPEAVHRAGASVQGWTISELAVDEDDWEAHIIEDL